MQNSSRSDLMLPHRVKPNTLLSALLTAALQLVISVAEYSLTAHAYDKIGTQSVVSSVTSVCSWAPGKEFMIELVARKKEAMSGHAAKPKRQPLFFSRAEILPFLHIFNL